MLTKIHIKNFKRFDSVEVELGQPVVFIGPNNMGKTTALQALTLWDVGLRTWLAKYGGDKAALPRSRPGVTLNRNELAALPLPSTQLLWKDRQVRSAMRVDGKQQTTNIRVEIIVERVALGIPWVCGLEFDYANPESIYCRTLREGEDATLRMPVPSEASSQQIAYLPPMSGLADREFIKQQGEIGFLVGQGQTAQVLRNLCYQVAMQDDSSAWSAIVAHIERLFGVRLLEPLLNPALSELTIAYRDADNNELDIAAAGRGLQQTLLLLTYLYSHPNSALLLDEPDAHLEILRQRQIFNLLTEVAETQNSQIIAASHSEAIMNEAVGSGRVVAFLGKPHTISDKGSQLLKSLSEIGFDHYYQAAQRGWVLYLEDATDLAILRAFAALLQHPALELLEAPFFQPVTTNLPQRARDHFYGLREAKSDLVGIAIFDRLEKELHRDVPLIEAMWQKREIENYLCQPAVLEAYASSNIGNDLFGHAEAERRLQAMQEAIKEVTAALQTLGKASPWSDDIKASDEFLDPLFHSFSKKLGVPLVLRKGEYSKLVQFLDPTTIDSEIGDKLDMIVAVASRARPA